MLDNKLQRRSFLGTGLATVGGLLLPKTFKGNNSKNEKLADENASGYTVFLSESGHYGKGGLYVLAILMTTNSEALHEAVINDFRVTRSYRSRMTYHDGDRFKVPFAKDCIDYFFNTDKLSFTAIVVHQPEVSGDDGNFSNLQLRLQKINLIQQYTNILGNISKVVVRSQSPFGPSQNFLDLFLQQTNLDYEARDIITGNNLLQLVDQMGGSVYGDIKGIVRNKKKLELIQYLKTKVGVSNFNPPISTGTKFKIYEYTL